MKEREKERNERKRGDEREGMIEKG